MDLDSYRAPGLQYITFVGSYRCQCLLILSMGQDGVLKKIVTPPRLSRY